MTANFLEQFLLASPDFQAKYIELQRERDRREIERDALREAVDKQRREAYETLPRWRRYWYEFFTWLAYLPLPKF